MLIGGVDSKLTLRKTLSCPRKIFLKAGVLIGCLFASVQVNAQYVFHATELPQPLSILKYAAIADVGHKIFSINDIKTDKARLHYKPISGNFGNLGFTNKNYWVKTAFRNSLNVPVLYYLQTAEPVTNKVNLYLVDSSGKVSTQKSGDDLDENQRSQPFRKTVFSLQLQPGQQVQAFIELNNDGEKNSLPLLLISPQKMLKMAYQEQFKMGIFYGLLFMIAVTYLFFYFALNERSFLYYSLYVSCTGLCQFALDGFYHQYIGVGHNWLDLHFVIISAIFGSYFFGKYSEIILETKENNTAIHQIFKVLYVLLGLLAIGIIISPSFLSLAYPIINILTFGGMLLIFSCVFLVFYRKKPIDLFYTVGVSILFVCIFLAILMNFGVFPTHFAIENITKPGIGLEILALSLSMANRIRLLKTNKEESQTIALQKSQEMNDLKSHFLSNMSHELRTPLNAILGLSSVMESETNDAKTKANFEVIKNASFRLISSVNDILDFSRIERSELVLDKVAFNPETVLDRMAAVFKRQAVEKGLLFDYLNTADRALSVSGDAMRLEQVLHNLLSNAIKFTDKGSVKLSVASLISGEDVQFAITISDTGIGIDKEKLNSVFNLFSQIDINHKRKFGGFGIGLSVVKALVDLQQGKIELQSEPGLGTTCKLTLNYPLLAQKAKVPQFNETVLYDLGGKHILVVEDNKMNQMVIKMMLKKWQNTTVSFADDGSLGLEILKNSDIDLVLMDLQMPVMDGYEAIEAIRNGAAGIQNNEIPIVVITADVTNDAKERAFELGANDYMTKPLDQQLLYQKASSFLKLYRAS